MRPFLAEITHRMCPDVWASQGWRITLLCVDCCQICRAGTVLYDCCCWVHANTHVLATQITSRMTHDERKTCLLYLFMVFHRKTCLVLQRKPWVLAAVVVLCYIFGSHEVSAELVTFESYVPHTLSVISGSVCRFSWKNLLVYENAHCSLMKYCNVPKYIRDLCMDSMCMCWIWQRRTY